MSQLMTAIGIRKLSWRHPLGMCHEQSKQCYAQCGEQVRQSVSALQAQESAKQLGEASQRIAQQEHQLVAAQAEIARLKNALQKIQGVTKQLPKQQQHAVSDQASQLPGQKCMILTSVFCVLA